jgi:hypothetical protein
VLGSSAGLIIRNYSTASAGMCEVLVAVRAAPRFRELPRSFNGRTELSVLTA